MKRLIPLLGVLIALPATADIVGGDAQPVSFVSSTDSLRVASTSPQWQLQTPAELDETAMPEVSVQSPRYQMPVPQDQTSAPLGAFRAIPWAVAHPPQAWRVLLPSVN